MISKLIRLPLILLKPSLLLKPSFFKFSDVSKRQLRFAVNPQKKTEIISLSNEEITQLAQINHYTASVQYLKQNNLQKSLVYLQYALSDAQTKFPYSVNLHCCLMNRISIIYKLTGKDDEFVQTLENLYLMTLSAKGPKALDTQKCLVNYLISLMINHRQKALAVLNFVKEQQNGQINALLYFDGVLDIIQNNSYQSGIAKLKGLPEDTSANRYFKFNTIGWMKFISISAQKYQNEEMLKSALIKESGQILELYLKALTQAENTLDQGFDHEQTQRQLANSDHFLQMIKEYLNKQIVKMPKFNEKNLLRNPQSHIITMNIALLLFQMQRFDESFNFLQYSLEKAIALNQIQRIGLSLILMARSYHRQGKSENWQKILLDLLKNAKKFSRAIVKQALVTYSHLLSLQGRMVQAQNYFLQSEQINAKSGLEGLILPNYDFTF